MTTVIILMVLAFVSWLGAVACWLLARRAVRVADSPRIHKVFFTPIAPGFHSEESLKPYDQAKCGWATGWYDGGIGWIPGKLFTGEDAFAHACAHAMEETEMKTDALRREVIHHKRRSANSNKTFEVKARRFYVMPVVVFEAYVDPSLVDVPSILVQEGGAL